MGMGGGASCPLYRPKSIWFIQLEAAQGQTSTELSYQHVVLLKYFRNIIRYHIV